MHSQFFWYTSIGSYVIYAVGASQFVNTMGDSGGGLMLLGLGAAITSNIWATIDAVKVAKVNNMYLRDLRRTSGIEINISPKYDSFGFCGRNVHTMGLSLGVTF